VSFVNKLRLDGQACVVLGAGAGMGAECCRALAEAGARLVCVDRDPALAEAMARELGGLALTEDVTTRAGMERIFVKAVERYGQAVKGVVDIVGIATIGPVDGFDDAALATQFDIVLRHAILAVQVGAPLLARHGGGAMTFIGSNSGMKSVPGQAIYGTAKAALHHFVRCSAREFGPRGVRMNVVAPSFVRTPRLLAKLGADFWRDVDAAAPLGRAGTTEDVASAVLFLQSALAGYVTGNILTLDGGTDVIAAIPTP
jgi:NAD(P)-dependent dehydrogenase (short-subunit alcohol dehydrogenase family)